MSALPNQTPTLAGVIRMAIDSAQRSVYTALPARVESYDATSQTCSAQPVLLGEYIDEAGDRQTLRDPIIENVPVVFPSAGDFAITFPLSAGDTVLLVFSSRSLDKWLIAGGEIDPNDGRRQHLSDAIAIPGLRALPDAIGSDGTSGNSLVVKGGSIRLGSSAANDPVVRKSDLDAFVSTFNTHFHPTPSGPSSAPDATTRQGDIECSTVVRSL